MILFEKIVVRSHPLGFFDRVEFMANTDEIECIIRDLQEALKRDGDSHYISLIADKVVDKREALDG